MDEYLSRWSAATPFCSRIMSRALRPWQRPAAQSSTALCTRANSRASRLKRLGMGLLALGLSQGAMAWTIGFNYAGEHGVDIGTGSGFVSSNSTKE